MNDQGEKEAIYVFWRKLRCFQKHFTKKKERKENPSKYHFYFKIVGILQLKNSFWNVFIAIQVLILKMQKLLVLNMCIQAAPKIFLQHI